MGTSGARQPGVGTAEPGRFAGVHWSNGESDDDFRIVFDAARTSLDGIGHVAGLRIVR